MAFPVTLRKLSQVQQEIDGSNHLNGASVVLPATHVNGNVVVTGSLSAASYIGLPGVTAPLGLGPGTSPPARNLDVGDTSNPQIRLTNAATFYTDLFTGPTGNLRILPSGGKVAINLNATPAQALEVFDAANPQLRLTQAAGAQYADCQVNASGYLLLIPSGVPPAPGRVGIGVQTLTTAPNALLTVLGSQPAAVATTPGTNADVTAQIGSGGAGVGVGGNTTIATTGTAGNGANITLRTGAGGQATAATTLAKGGNGGTLAFTGGTGGAQAVNGGAANTGGDGGPVSFTSGAGGAATANSGVNTGGNGAVLTIQAGAGGAANSGATNNAGAGGAMNLFGGNGAAGSTANGAGGSIVIGGGNSGGAGVAAGSVTIRGGAPGAGSTGSVKLTNSTGATARVEVNETGLGFFTHAPIAQPTAAGNTATVAAGSTTSVFTNTSFSGGVGSTGYTVGDIVAALKNLGLVAA